MSNFFKKSATSNFFKKSDGSMPASTGEAEKGGNSLIPDKTVVLAAPDEAKWEAKEKYGTNEVDEYISVRWSVLAPAEYKNRKIFQKLRVNDPNGKKADKDKDMLFAMDFNAGGGLAKLDHSPTDIDLSRCLVNKPMQLLVMEYHIQKSDGTGTIDGNWIAKVSPKGASAQVLPPLAQQAQGFDSDVPF